LKVLDREGLEKKITEAFAGKLTAIPKVVRDQITEIFSTLDANVVCVEPPYPREFLEFFQAMSEEMLRHEPEKGYSWKDDEYVKALYERYSSMPPARIMGKTDEYLRDLLIKAVDQYFESREPHQLVDIGNICGMIWCRDTILHPTRVLKDLEEEK